MYLCIHVFSDSETISILYYFQNLETSAVSRQHATILLDTALDQSKWELAKDLVRFLRAIGMSYIKKCSCFEFVILDPNDVESPRTSFILQPKLGLSQQTPPVTPNAEDLSLILGNVQGPRVRSYSTTISPKIPDTRVGTANVNVSTLTESPAVSRKKSVASNATVTNANNTNKTENK